MKQDSLPPASEKARAARLETLRHEKMAASAHAYVRGSTLKFYEWLENLDRARLPEGPAVWICGDCHVGNLGPVGSTDGELEIQLRDFDQTVIGNPAHDLVRLGLSLAMAARSSDLPGVTTAEMIEHMTDGYARAFKGDESHRKTPMPKPVRAAMARAAGRSWKHLADERIEGVEPVIPLGKRFWPLTDTETKSVASLFAQENIRKLATALRGRDDDAPVTLLDAAYWRKGCSSLGLLRIAALVSVGKGKDAVQCLIDLKEATRAAAPRDGDARMPRDNAERVVAGARALSPFLGDRMLPVTVLDRPVFVRELLPQDLKLELDDLDTEEAREVAWYLAGVVGRAHARQLAPADRKEWMGRIRATQASGIDAPAWLWSSVVELIGIHEAAYLEHCRKYVLARDARRKS